MRVIGGDFKGRAIRTPEGRETRPTSDRARESLFNLLAHAPWAPPLKGARVMDVFAGSGSLGIEALSRGADFCLFVETSSLARGCIRDNIESFQVFGKTRIHRRSATDLGVRPAGLGAPFDLVFLDPPYAYDLCPAALDQLAQGGWLASGAIAVCETASSAAAPDVAGWERLDERVYGAARLAFLRKVSGNEDASADG